ncbi:putative 5-methylcytosine-specific restriction enzyme McrBC, subunit McrB [Cupriavidus taiwanensis]|uniref:McrB family protein n=1 Tax=Cupriavidus taiwanensis TaxID=164546 RepID=UPI000E12A505|nr:AAA family ATPase [Cupriavidus taiwanensis]SOY54117.1 putative 5-methylcytosine-specific restriction enzyme McrBC, subunit McrB [Cupriavidus taiwanensis]
MSRHIPNKPNARLTYEAAQKFKDTALIGQRSLFLGDEISLWTPQNFESLMKNYVQNPIAEDDGRGTKFWDKLRYQVGRCPPESIALFAEIYWVLVFPSSSLTRSKRKRIDQIWAMAKGRLPAIKTSSLLTPETLAGVGSTGTAYNFLLWMELAYAIRLFKNLSEKSEGQRRDLLENPWEFARWMESMDDTKGRQLYHILCHALFPDSFERIFSDTGKEALARRTDLGIPKAARANRPARDTALLEVRQRLEAEHPGKDIDFYVFPPLLARKEKTFAKKAGGKLPTGSQFPAGSTSRLDELFEDEADDDLEADAAKVWRPRNRIFFGPPGSGKTRAMETIRASRYRAGEHVVFVSFHPSYSYEDFVEGYRPAPGEGGRLGARPVAGPFREICERAHKHPDVRHTLFIDEINRANVAKVFGELITLLEATKRCAPTPDLDFSEVRSSARLQYSGDMLAIPANLDIVASMNTADRSVQAIDRALRRRFEFLETPADAFALPKAPVGGVDLRALLVAINDRIEFLLDSEHAIGHALFMGVNNLWDLRRAVSRRVIPLLQEYFFEDISKAKLALIGSAKPSVFFVERELDASKLFDSWTDIDGREARVSIRPSVALAKWSAADFLSLYLRGEALSAAIAELPATVAAEHEEGVDEEYEDTDEMEDISGNSGGASKGGRGTTDGAGDEAGSGAT